MFCYALVEGDFWLASIGPYHAYGLQVVKMEHGSHTVLTTVQDIFTDKEFVTSLAQRLTFYQLDPIHLPDVLEDIL